MERELDLARRFVALQPVPGRVVHAGIVGAHLYGFPSPDSDIDIKGIHLAPTEAYLGLAPPRQAFDRVADLDGVECDLTTQELRQALELLLKGNGNILERLVSPWQVVESDELEELRHLAAASIHRGFAGHYRGYFLGMCREHRNRKRAKSALYAIRVALTGAHLMRTGRCVADVRVLAEGPLARHVQTLIEAKQEAEKAPLSEALDVEAQRWWPQLEDQLQQAYDASPLPDKAPNRAAIEAFLVRLRRAALGE